MVLDDCLLRPVTKTMCSMPASRASSTAYCTTGRSTIVSISFGIDFGRRQETRSQPRHRYHCFPDFLHGVILLRRSTFNTCRPRKFLHVPASSPPHPHGKLCRKPSQPDGDRHAQMPERCRIAERRPIALSGDRALRCWTRDRKDAARAGCGCAWRMRPRPPGPSHASRQRSYRPCASPRHDEARARGKSSRCGYDRHSRSSARRRICRPWPAPRPAGCSPRR